MTTLSVSRLLLLAGVLGALLPAHAAAQAVSSFGQLQTIVRTGQMVEITDNAGRHVRGKIASISESSLAIESKDGRSFTENTTVEVRRTDSPWNGALIGAGVGLGVFAAGRMTCEANQWNCDAARGAENWIPGSPFSAWVGPLAGGIVGALIDRGRGNVVIYRAPSRSARLLTVSVLPALGRASLGGALTMQF